MKKFLSCLLLLTLTLFLFAACSDDRGDATTQTTTQATTQAPVVHPIVSALTKLHEGMSLTEVIAILGEDYQYIGSGEVIQRYLLSDGTLIVIPYHLNADVESDNPFDRRIISYILLDQQRLAVDENGYFLLPEA